MQVSISDLPCFINYNLLSCLKQFAFCIKNLFKSSYKWLCCFKILTNATIEQRLTTIEQRLNTIEQCLITLEQRLTALEQRLNTLEQRLFTIEQRLITLEQQLQTIEQRFSASGLLKSKKGCISLWL